MLVSSCCLELHNTSKCECITVKVAMIVCLFGLFLLLVITVCCLYLPHIKFNLLHVLPLVLGVVFVPGCLFFLLPWLVSKQSKLFFLSIAASSCLWIFLLRSCSCAAYFLEIFAIYVDSPLQSKMRCPEGLSHAWGMRILQPSCHWESTSDILHLAEIL